MPIRRRYKKKVGKVTKATKKYVKRILDDRIEDKTNFVKLDFTIDQATWNASLLNGMINGPQQGERLGNQIKCKYLIVRAQFISTAITAPGSLVRMMIVQDKVPSGDIPVTSGADGMFYDDSTNQGPVAIQQIETRNNRYIYHKDITFPLMNYGGSTNQSLWVIKTFKIPLKFKTEYNLSDPAVGDETRILKNALWVMFKTTNNMVANVSFQSVLQFEDA